MIMNSSSLGKHLVDNEGLSVNCNGGYKYLLALYQGSTVLGANYGKQGHVKEVTCQVMTMLSTMSPYSVSESIVLYHHHCLAHPYQQ